jgi:hypothetical protein
MKQIWNFIASLNKSNRTNKSDMSNTEQLEKVRIFQWIKGDSFGKIVTLKSQDKEFFYFTDGSQIYKSVAKEFLLEALDGDEPLPGINNPQKINRGVDGPGSQPSTDLAKVKQNNPPNNSPQEISQTSPKNPTESPLQSLITKLSQKNVETVDFKLGINLPKREVFEILLENSDESEEELLNTITESVSSRIDIDNLKNYIKEQLNIYIKNYYNG